MAKRTYKKHFVIFNNGGVISATTPKVQIPVKLTTSIRSKLTTDFTGEDFIFLL
jgi:hypothetical protein